MKLLGKFTLERYVNRAGKKPIDIWLNAQELNISARIEARLLNVELGNFGDHKSIGNQIWELRFHFGAGYRVYFAQDGKRLILLLLCAGTKGTQKKDINTAKEYWQDYLERSKK